MRNNFLKILSQLIFSIVLTLVSAIWIQKNIANVPPLWDTAWYINLGFHDYEAFRNGIFPFINTFILQDPSHAPLFPATSLPFFLIFGPGIQAAYLTNVVYLFILITSVFYITERLADGKAAMLAAFFIATFPAAIAFSRDYLFEFPLAALTALSYLFVLKSDSFKSRMHSILFGICAAFAILTKTMGIVFFVVPFLYAIYVFVKAKGAASVKKNVALAFLCTAVIASIFYVPNFKSIFGYLFGFGFGEGSAPYSMGISSLWSIQNWSHYMKAITFLGISLPYTVVFLIAFAASLLFRDSGKKLSKDYFFIWSWFIIGYILLSIPANKGGERYALPILAPVAVVMATTISRISLKWLRYIVISAAIFAGIANYAYQTIARDCNYDYIEYSGMQIARPIHIACFVKNTDNLAVPYEKNWDIMPILQYMAAAERMQEPIRVLIAVDHYFLNGCTLQLYATLGRLDGTLHSNFVVDGLANRQLTEDEVKAMISNSHFIITKTGYQGPDFSNTNNHLATQYVKNIVPTKSFMMSDGSTVFLYTGTAP